jgi:hypothetical protein
MLCLSYYGLCLLFNIIRDKGQNRFCLEVRREARGGKGGEMTQTMYAHVDK